MEKEDFAVNICKKIAQACIQKLILLTNGEVITKHGDSFGDFENDTEIKADTELAKLAEKISKVKGVGRITIEGYIDTVINDVDSLWICVDPVDGSLNYQARRGSLGLPYSACITVLGKIKKAIYNDVIAAGIIDLRNNDYWETVFLDGRYCTKLNSCPCFSADVNKLDLGQMIVIGEMYYPENRELLARIFANKKGWLRNPGSAAYEMALVSNGTAVAYICDRQKQHESGAGFALVKGAGGVAIDFDGNDLGSCAYKFNTQSPVILAANQCIADDILALLKTARSG